MTVKQLIEDLQKQDPEKEVAVSLLVKREIEHAERHFHPNWPVTDVKCEIREAVLYV